MTSNVNDVLSAITLASEALAREPGLHEKINFLQRDLDQSQTHNQNLELRIVDYKSNIESLEAKVRSLEVERDQAQFRTLELEDAYTGLAQSITLANDRANAAFEKLYPKPPEPVVEPSVPVTPTPSHPELAVSDNPAPVTEQVPASPPSTPYPEPQSSNQPAPTADPVGFAGLSEADVKPSGRYSGLKWHEANPRCYNKAEWLANGGTEEGWNA